MVYMGLESGSDKVLEYMKKGADSKEMIKAAEKSIMQESGCLSPQFQVWEERSGGKSMQWKLVKFCQK